MIHAFAQFHIGETRVLTLGPRVLHLSPEAPDETGCTLVLHIEPGHEVWWAGVLREWLAKVEAARPAEAVKP